MIDEIRVLKAARFRPCHCDRNCPLNYGDKKGEIPRLEGKLWGRADKRWIFPAIMSLSVGGGVGWSRGFLGSIVALMLITQSLIIYIRKEPIVHFFIVHDNIVMAN
ncbi:hypothetical protein CEXT_192001 [Caerostris extrusa]|uniref:Uncharacterized protein n=1 Tax=Caerostris extrusa TaxID=172846 RepID=A0AAV4UWQ6_CAEEX|nr:hypothetical protein CEXT_192001 [Caerostris extrusa]